MKKFYPYKSVFMVGWERPHFFKNSAGDIVLIDDEMSEVFVICDDHLRSLGFEWEEKFKGENFEVATRKEIQEAGLWNMVINKDNYSSEQDEIETKLEEYQKLGEEILKNKK